MSELQDLVALIRAEMEQVMRKTGFTGDFAAFLARLRTDPRFLFPNTDEGREGYLQTSRDYYGGIEARIVMSCVRHFGPEKAGRIKPYEYVRFPPDLAIEVLSPSTARTGRAC